MLECVPNVSEGRDGAALDALAAACGPSLLDRHVDADHHRSVFTLAGPGHADAAGAARRLARAVAERLDVSSHAGVHPRLGALDVVPFVALGAPLVEAVDAAQEFAEWIAADLGVAVFRYDAADPAGRSLPEARRTAFRSRAPDLGPDRPHPRLGAVAVGARPPLIAVNCWLATDDLPLARAVAREVRARDGGLPGVRALGLALPSRGVAQVSMNLVDLAATGLEQACAEVRARVEAAGGRVARVEVVGLLPESELDRSSEAFLAWAGIDRTLTIEARLGRRAP